MKKVIIGLTLSVLVLAPLLALGTAGDGSEPKVLISGVAGLCQFIRTIVNIVFSVIMIVAVIFILFAAWNYLTAGGSGEKVETATKQLTNAIIAVVIAVLAWSIPMVVTGFLYNAANLGSGPGRSIFTCPSES